MTSLKQFQKQYRAKLKAEEEKKNAPNATELRNKKSDERTEDLIKKYAEIRSKENPTKSDTTNYNMLAMRANKPFLTPKKESTKKDNKVALDEIEKAKQKIIFNNATSNDSLTLYNAGMFNKDLSDKEQEKYKPNFLKKAEREAEKSRELKDYKEQVQPVVMEMVDVEDADGYVKKIAKYYLEKDGKKTEITKKAYDRINEKNREKLKKYVDPSVDIMGNPDDPDGIG